jgi:two-component system cell cycle sensor histidine kinase/response regulator CckA
MKEQSVQDRYFELLKAYSASPEEKYLAAVAELGRELVVFDAPPEDIVEIHEGALGRLAQEKPDLTLADAVPDISTPLMELLMIHSLAFRERAEARARAEAALRTSEGLLRRVIDTSPDCIFVRDGDGKYVLVNAAMAELYGTTPEQMVGMTGYDLVKMSKISVEAAEKFVAGDQEVIESRQSRFIPEQLLVLPDGTTRWFQITKMPLVRERTPDCVLVIAVDITERKRVEELMRKQERLAAVGELAARITLDLNNMMTSIILTVQMLKDQPGISTDLSLDLDVVLNEARRASDLGEQILDLSRRSYIETRPVDLRLFVADVVETLRQTLPEGLRLLVDVGQEEYMVEADSARLRRAVMNLVVAPQDAMPAAGEVRIGLSRIEVTPDGSTMPVADMTPGEWGCITVSDTRFDISPQDLPHIFEPFFTTQVLGKRTSFNLAQAYGIVAQHGGHIAVKTMEEQGATFQIYLPAGQAEKMREVEEGEERDWTVLQGRGETILLVEDEDNLRAAAKKILESLGYHVLTATNGREALEVYRSAPRVDLMITDLVMPEMGGKELLRELSKITPDLKALVITGYLSPEALQGLKDEGFLNIVPKPFTVDILTEATYQALRED